MNRESTTAVVPRRVLFVLLGAIGDVVRALPPAPVEFGLKLSPDEQRRADMLIADAPRPLVGVILGSSWPSRIYPADHIAAAVSEIATANGNAPAFFPVLVGGSEDTAIA